MNLLLSRSTNKILSWLLVFIVTFGLTINNGLSREALLQKPQEWQLNGLMAALDDSDSKIWQYSLNKLSTYELKELSSPLEIPQEKYQKILELLSDERNPLLQEAAAKAIKKIGKTNKSQAKQLGELLTNSGNVEVEVAAILGLGNMGKAAKSQANKIENSLITSDDIDVQRFSIYALKNIGALKNLQKAAKVKAPQLGQLLLTSEPKTMADRDRQVATVYILGRMGEVDQSQASLLIKLLKNARRDDMKRAITSALGDMGKAEELFDILVNNDDYDTQKFAAEALVRMGEVAQAQAPKLLDLIVDSTSEDFGIRSLASKALGRMGKSAKSQIPQLLEIITTRGSNSLLPYHRESAAKALGEMGRIDEEIAQEIIPQLVEPIIAPNPSYTGRYVADALEEMGKAAQNVIPQLIEFTLSSGNVSRKQTAAEVIFAIGITEKNQALQLGKILETSQDKKVQENLIRSLGAMGEAAGEQAPILGELLVTSSEPTIKKFAAEALGEMGKAAIPQTPKLAELLTTSDKKIVIASAASAIGKISINEEEAALLGELLTNSDDEYLQRVAASALGDMGATAKNQAPLLEKLLIRSPNKYLKQNLIEALGDLGEAAQEQAPTLGKILKAATRKDNTERLNNFTLIKATAIALGKIGVVAKEQIPVLEELFSISTSDSVKLAAAEALGKMGQTKQLGELLVSVSSDEYGLKSTVIEALEDLGVSGKEQVPNLARMLATSQDIFVQCHIDDALKKMEVNNLPAVLQVLDAIDRELFSPGEYRFLAYFISNGEEESVAAIQSR